MSYGRGEGPDDWEAVARVRMPKQLCFVDCGKDAPECVCRQDVTDNQALAKAARMVHSTGLNPRVKALKGETDE